MSNENLRKKTDEDNFFDVFTVEATAGSSTFNRVAKVIASNLKSGHKVVIKVDDRDVIFYMDKNNEVQIEGNL